MLFNSYTFIFIFLPAILAGFWGLSRIASVRIAYVWLTAASILFYGFWNLSYLPLLLASIFFNYVTGHLISSCLIRSTQAKILLIAGITTNLLFIGYYKYLNFLLSSVSALFSINLYSNTSVLPLAISFYTFTQIAYLVDAYRGEVKGKKYDLITYTLFVTFFPQLIAGPILRHDELIPQLKERRKFYFLSENFAPGLVIFILGLAKKVLIADSLSPWVSSVFNNVDNASLLSAWIGALSYTFQLYFDFSGYSDMAVGLGWMFNIQLPINFNSPYKAGSIIDFWRRWHITLSNFLRDYLYIPLGGSRNGRMRHYVNLLTTMLLGGLWHGAGWTFVFWGGLHGTYLVINHWWHKNGVRLPRAIAWGVTFLAVVVSWMFFRAESFEDGAALLKAMIGFSGSGLPDEPFSLSRDLIELGVQVVVLLSLLLGVLYLPNTQEMIRSFKPRLRWAIVSACIFTASLMSLNQVSEFLYFQF